MYKVGHELWLTALEFLLGVVFGMHEVRMRAWAAAVLFIVACGALFALYMLSSQRQFNTVLIVVANISVSLWLAQATPVLRAAGTMIVKLEKYLLEIFLIHTYLFIHFSGSRVVDFVTSALLVVLAAMVLHLAVEWMSERIFGRKRAGRRSITALAPAD